MTDPIAVAASAVPDPASAAATAPAQADPADARMFAKLMAHGPDGSAVPGAGSDAIGDMAASWSAHLRETRSFDDIRSSMLQAYDPHDPIKSMFMMTSSSMEAQVLFSKLHVSTSLASAATSLFGNLLKNQQ